MISSAVAVWHRPAGLADGCFVTFAAAGALSLSPLENTIQVCHMGRENGLPISRRTRKVPGACGTINFIRGR